MKNAIVFPLKTSTAYSKDPKETFESLTRVIKNSLLFFEEIWFEADAYQVTYGDTHTFSSILPYNNVGEYKTLRTMWTTGPEKREAYIRVKPMGANWATVASSPARSYYVSLQGELECLLENYSKNELSFLKYIWVKDRRTVEKAVAEMAWKLERDIKESLRQVCSNWEIGNICGNFILRETIEAMFLSRACNSPPVIDELHKDVIGIVDNLTREIGGEQIRINTLSRIMQIAIPDYSDFTIARVLDLRDDPSIKEFRKAITEISTKLIEIPDKDAYLAISQEINKRLVKDIKNIAPKGFRNIFLSAAADCILAIPFLSAYVIPLLLAGLGKTGITAIGDIRKTDKWKTSFGCFWMKLSD